MPSSYANLSRSRLFWLLMGASALTAALPRSYTDWMRAPTQLLVPAQYVMFSTAGAVREAAASLAKSSVSYSEHERVRVENQQLTHELVALSSQVRELQRERDELLRLRAAESLRPFRLIPANIVATDIMSWRDALIIDQGRAKNVSRSDWVTTRRFLDVGQRNGLPESGGLAVLAAEFLIGRLEAVRPFTSRVRLFSDNGQKGRYIRVQVARRDGSSLTFPVADADPEQSEFPLEGAGGDEMRVTQVPRKHWDEGRIRPDDLIVTSPRETTLPATLVIGNVRGMADSAQKNPLLCELRVGWPFDWTDVRRVFIAAPVLQE